MSTVLDILRRNQIRELLELRARLRMTLDILKTAAYAMIGGTFFDSVIKGVRLSLPFFAWTALGFVFLVVVILLAPYAEDEKGAS